MTSVFSDIHITLPPKHVPSAPLDSTLTEHARIASPIAVFARAALHARLATMDTPTKLHPTLVLSQQVPVPLASITTALTASLASVDAHLAQTEHHAQLVSLD